MLRLSLKVDQRRATEVLFTMQLVSFLNLVILFFICIWICIGYSHVCDLIYSSA